MCLGSKPPKDNSAEIARQEEEARQARIKQGQSAIDTEFAQFDDPFFTNYQNNYTGYYIPQVEDQYQKAREKLTLKLAGSGNLNAGAGADALGDLRSQYELRRGDITNQALDAVNQRKNEIEGIRSDLYNQNRASADPAAAATLAASRSGGLVTPPAYTPIGDLFGNLLQNYAINVAAGSRNDKTNLPSSLFNPGTSGSARVIQ